MITGASRRPRTVSIYRWLAVVVLVALTLPRMTQRGIFGDGLIYATIARNMSTGVGAFWAPTYTLTRAPTFYDAPPVGLGLEAAAFRVLGDHLYVERVYSLLMFGLTAFLMSRLWRRVQPAEFDWLPIMLWALPSIVTWCAINNMLENTQAVFTTAAVLMIVTAFHAASSASAAWWSGLAALASVAAVLTKGPVGLFPFAAPVLYWLLPYARDAARPSARPTKRALTIFSTMVAVGAAAVVCLAAYAPSRHALTEYVRMQVVASLSGQREVNGDPFASVRHLGLGIVARLLVVSGVFWIFGRRGSGGINGPVSRWFLALALCASVPIAISPKLAGHYFLPSVPLYAIGVAVMTIRPASRLIRDDPGWHRRVPVWLTVALLAATVVVPYRYGSLEPRDRALLREMDALAPAMPARGTIIGACRALPNDMALDGYMNRLFEVSIDASDAPVNGWLLQPDRVCAPPPFCAAAARGDRLVLFSCPR